MIRLIHIPNLLLTTAISAAVLLLLMQAPQNRGFPAEFFEISAQLRDTFPDEYFDEPLGGREQSETSRDIFQDKAKPNKVIPVVQLETDSTYVELNKIPEDYTGYKIEIMASEAKLPYEHDIFFQHGNLAMEMKADSTYSYLLGDFEKRRKAEDFLLDLLRDRYPEARVIEYQKGERLY